MLPIGGNSQLVFQTRILGEPNSIGERERVYVDVDTLEGYLDYQTGNFAVGDSNAKLASTSHIFIADYKPLTEVSETASRAVVGNDVYNVLMIDNPMGLNYHWEIYLEYLGVSDAS